MYRNDPTITSDLMIQLGPLSGTFAPLRPRVLLMFISFEIFSFIGRKNSLAVQQFFIRPLFHHG